MAPGQAKRRASIVCESARLLSELVKHGVRTLLFCRTRAVAELVLARTQEMLPRDLAQRVASYRGGYMPAERRATERALCSGELLAVAATCALELGVDVGDVDATVHVGFPSSVASLWQQAAAAP
eukprot:72824-Pleurochrysis_carterae.AAC.1